MEHPKLKEICASHVIEFACFLDLNFQSCDFIDVNNFITGAEEGGKGKGEGEGKGKGKRGRGKGEGWIRRPITFLPTTPLCTFTFAL